MILAASALASFHLFFKLKWNHRVYTLCIYPLCLDSFTNIDL